jgi:uncharacterized protein YgiM (DUF1202 family)
MNPFRRVLFLISLSVIMLSSCNLPISIKADEPSTEQIEQLALTIVVQTQQAQAALATEPPPAPVEAPTQQLGTFVSVSTATNCRTGPDINYSLILTFQPGATAEVVGKYSPSNYWIINTPTGGTCWLWGAYASVQGDTSTLPEIAAPPPPVAAVQPTDEPPSDDGGGGDGGGGGAVPTISVLVLNPGVIQLLLVPLPPSSFSATANCNYITFPTKLLIGKTDKLSWSSVSNATGYYVYVNGLQIKDTTSTTTSVDALAMSASNYGVASYNSKGTSTVKTISAPSCP